MYPGMDLSCSSQGSFEKHFEVVIVRALKQYSSAQRDAHGDGKQVNSDVNFEENREEDNLEAVNWKGGDTRPKIKIIG